MNKKKAFALFAMTKIPLLIYLTVVLYTLPTINQINHNSILGAHRGDSINYTENTIEAIKAALEKKDYSFIEFDVQYTKDGKIVVFHDKTLMRLQGKKLYVNNLTYEELQNISEFNIPLYEEVIEIIKDTKKTNIEIKSSGNTEKDKELIDFVVKDAKQRGILENIMISSISRKVVIYVNEKYPDMKTGQIFFIKASTFIHFGFLTKWLYEEIDETGADYVMLYGSNIHNIDNLIKLKPEDKTLVFWFFSDEMYIIQKDKENVMW